VTGAAGISYNETIYVEKWFKFANGEITKKEIEMIEIGKPAPDFSLPDQNGKIHKLSDYKGKYVALYFYPKDDTPGCTKEACSFRDGFAGLKKAGIEILGVSTDDEISHTKFIEKYKLPFTLLADKDKKIVEKYGVWVEKNMYGKNIGVPPERPS